jgi:hypothetical protein
VGRAGRQQRESCTRRRCPEGDCTASLGSRLDWCYAADITGVKTVTGRCDAMRCPSPATPSPSSPPVSSTARARVKRILADRRAGHSSCMSQDMQIAQKHQNTLLFTVAAKTGNCFFLGRPCLIWLARRTSRFLQERTLLSLDFIALLRLLNKERSSKRLALFVFSKRIAFAIVQFAPIEKLCPSMPSPLLLNTLCWMD